MAGTTPARTERDDLSTREEVRQRLARGETPRAIAKALDLTTQAVYKHMASLRAEAEGAA
jgi:hypothetical protein